MLASSNDYENAINKIIRGATSVVVKEYTQNDLESDRYGYYTSVDRTIYALNYVPMRDGTYYATFANCGYCVGDENLRCIPDEPVVNNTSAISKILPKNAYNYMFDNDNIKPNSDVYVMVEPVYTNSVSVFAVPIDSSNHVVGDYIKIDVTGITEPTVVHFATTDHLGKWAFGYITKTDNVRVSMYPPSARPDDMANTLFDNTNISSINFERSTDLLVQDEFRYSFELTALDLNREYDPSNPQGKYSNFTKLYRVLVMIGSEVSDGVYEYPFKRIMYLLEKPDYENQKIVCKFGLLPWAAQTKNNYLIRPKSSREDETLPTDNLFDYLFNVYVYPPNYPRAYVARIMQQKTGYVRADYNMLGYSINDNMVDTYKLLTNATGTYISEGVYAYYADIYGYTTKDFNYQLEKYFSGELKPAHHISMSDVFADGFKVNILPELKMLTVVKYTNTDSNSVAQTLHEVVSKDDFDASKTATIILSHIDTQIMSCAIRNVKGGEIVSTSLKRKSNENGLASLRLIVTTKDVVSSELSFDLDLYSVNQTRENVIFEVSETGEDMTVDNPFITTDKLVEIAQKTITAITNCREEYTLTIAHDIRLQIGDIITIDSLYEDNIPCIITGIKYTLPSVKEEIVCRRLHNVEQA